MDSEKQFEHNEEAKESLKKLQDDLKVVEAQIKEQMIAFAMHIQRKTVQGGILTEVDMLTSYVEELFNKFQTILEEEAEGALIYTEINENEKRLFGEKKKDTSSLAKKFSSLKEIGQLKNEKLIKDQKLRENSQNDSDLTAFPESFKKESTVNNKIENSKKRLVVSPVLQEKQETIIKRIAELMQTKKIEEFHMPKSGIPTDDLLLPTDSHRIKRLNDIQGINVNCS